MAEAPTLTGTEFAGDWLDQAARPIAPQTKQTNAFADTLRGWWTDPPDRLSLVMTEAHF